MVLGGKGGKDGGKNSWQKSSGKKGGKGKVTRENHSTC